MKNKKTLYILIPSVALIWGLIIWKVVDFSSEGSGLPGDGIYLSETVETDTSRYELKIDYRDPFLRRSRQPVVTSASQPAQRENNIRNVDIKSMKVPLRPEGLVYRGVISCKEERIGLLEIGPQKRLVKEKSLVGEYEIVSVENDSLRINYMEKVFVYGKQ